VLGALIAAMGCASCFLALGVLTSALGPGFLAQFEGAFINTLLPIFVWLAIIANGFSFLFHGIFIRLMASLIGPSFVLLTLYPLWSHEWSTYLFYIGLVMMVIVAIWEVISLPVRVCAAK